MDATLKQLLAERDTLRRKLHKARKTIKRLRARLRAEDVLTGLASGVYHYKVTALDADGNVYTGIPVDDSSEDTR